MNYLVRRHVPSLNKLILAPVRGFLNSALFRIEGFSSNSLRESKLLIVRIPYNNIWSLRCITSNGSSITLKPIPIFSFMAFDLRQLRGEPHKLLLCSSLQFYYDLFYLFSLVAYLILILYLLIALLRGNRCSKR